MKVDDIVKSYEELKSIVKASPVSSSYLKNVVASGNIGVHYSKKMSVSTFSVVKNKSNRTPTNTPEFIHDYIDTVYEYQYGVAYRSESLFTYVRNVNDATKGLYYVIPVGDNLDMMYVKGITDFYLQLLQDLDVIADSIVSKLDVGDMEPVYVSHLIDSISDNIELIDEEDTRQRIVLANREFLSKSLRNKILSDSFVKLVKKEILNHVDRMIKGNVVDNVNLGDVKKEELHIHSEKFVLINSTWAEAVAKEKGIDIKELFKSMV
jgi:hypothetical protein